MSWHRFEAEISGNNMFVPHQVRPIIGSNTYQTVQQKLQANPPAPTVQAPPQFHQPAFISSFIPHSLQQQHKQTDNSYHNEPTPAVLSSAPKLYSNRPTISLPHVDMPHVAAAQHQIDIGNIQFDVTQKLKKLKAEKSGPNPIAEAAIQAARASSALQNFQINEKRKKDKKVCCLSFVIFLFLILIDRHAIC